jgi:hypothetical protein
MGQAWEKVEVYELLLVLLFGKSMGLVDQIDELCQKFLLFPKVGS